MSRGPQIPQGLTFAIPFALRRGHVMVFMAALLNLAELLITGNGLFVLVRVRLARRIRAGIADIEDEFADAIAGLRLVPRTGPVSCELWLYSRYGTLRHFRIEDAGLVEIDCYGTPLGQGKPVRGPACTPDTTGTLPGPAAAGRVPGPAASVIDPKSPVYRWLVKWNAERKAGETAGILGSGELKQILTAGKPGGTVRQSPGKKPARKDAPGAGPDDPEKGQEPDIPVARAGEPAVVEAPAFPGSTANDQAPPSSGGNPGCLEYTGDELPAGQAKNEEAI
jgi:hypothetical protein